MAKITINISKDLLDSPAWKDKDLCLEARGMLITILANSYESQKIPDIISKSGLSEWTIRKGLILLENSGYLKRTRTRRKGKYDWDFIVSDNKEI